MDSVFGTWLGRRPKGQQDTNSFAAFVSKAKRTKEGCAHLKRHHSMDVQPPKEEEAA